MKIDNVITKSDPFQNLLKIINTPPTSKTGSICTIKGTTLDSRDIILKLLGRKSKRSFVYSQLGNKNIFNFLSSTKFYKDITYSKLKDVLEDLGFKREEQVAQSGTYNIRGDIIIFWPSIYTHPLRAEFWGEKLESQEMFDESYQTSITKLEEFVLSKETFLEDEVERQAIKTSSMKYPLAKTALIFDNSYKNKKLNSVKFHYTYPALFFNRFDILEKEITKRIKNHWQIQVSTRKPLEFLDKKYQVRAGKYQSGFENHKLRIAIYTDREIYGTIYIANEKARNKKKINRYLAQLEGEIKIGDYIVHEDYGIGTYQGIKQQKALGKLQDYLILEYAEGDKLSVPMSQIQKLTKYIGPDNVPPKITRLGRATWKTLKKKVKGSIVLMARELLKHYAKAEVAKGTPLPKHDWEDKFICEFEFEDTDCQKKATAEILGDLSKAKPMSRVLVGDVGFGKTEVAARAAFRVVSNDKQVAILCPTTILVSQHYSVFKHRMRKYPFVIETLSRFGSRKENAKVVEKLNSGKVDIVIGTHRLLSNDISFKDLGIIIIDEEQKFGVKQKEKIKKLAYNSHVLSMSATPIPRTLSMALSSLRDISIITTPPPGRKAIKTKVGRFDWNKASQAILKETDRGGQLYFLHNNVKTIESVKHKLEKLLPTVKFKVAHGQMHPATLDKVMREFYEKKFDCLVCTTIIENGIDIKNVNTIIVNKAQNFGLAQLHQLRGRVGRGRRQAYCYLFYDKKGSLKGTPKEKRITPKSQMRLEALMDSQELGAGFKIASRDLEIRGAGNLLGKEQHGNISAIGLGLYTQMIAEEVEKMKENNSKIQDVRYQYNY